MATSTVRQARRGRAGTTLLGLGAMLAGSLTLAGCQTSDYPEIQATGSLRAFRAEDRHPISVEIGEVRLDIDLPGYISDLSPRQKQQIQKFLRDYADLGEGEIIVAVPSGTANEGAAMRTVGEVRDLIAGAHIAKTAVRYVAYGSEAPGSEPPIVLSYNRFFANPSPCGWWPRNLAHEPYNKPYANFGCAQQNNLAAMVADPRDLVRPRDLSPGNAIRRQTVLDQYYRGEVTAAERSEAEQAVLSEVGEE